MNRPPDKSPPPRSLAREMGGNGGVNKWNQIFKEISRIAFRSESKPSISAALFGILNRGCVQFNASTLPSADDKELIRSLAMLKVRYCLLELTSALTPARVRQHSSAIDAIVSVFSHRYKLSEKLLTNLQAYDWVGAGAYSSLSKVFTLPHHLTRSLHPMKAKSLRSGRRARSGGSLNWETTRALISPQTEPYVADLGRVTRSPSAHRVEQMFGQDPIRLIAAEDSIYRDHFGE